MISKLNNTISIDFPILELVEKDTLIVFVAYLDPEILSLFLLQWGVGGHFEN